MGRWREGKCTCRRRRLEGYHSDGDTRTQKKKRARIAREQEREDVDMIRVRVRGVSSGGDGERDEGAQVARDAKVNMSQT